MLIFLAKIGDTDREWERDRERWREREEEDDKARDRERERGIPLLSSHITRTWAAAKSKGFFFLLVTCCKLTSKSIPCYYYLAALKTYYLLLPALMVSKVMNSLSNIYIFDTCRWSQGAVYCHCWKGLMGKVIILTWKKVRINFQKKSSYTNSYTVVCQGLFFF